MVTDTREQRSNNRLIIYDLNLSAWLPPFTINVCSLTAISGFQTDGTGGRTALLAGDYRGRILELFGPEVHSDDGCPIVAWAETPWLHFGAPHLEKSLRIISACSTASASGPSRISTVEIFTDGDSASDGFVEFTKLSASAENDFFMDQKPLDSHGRFFKFRVHLEAGSTLFGLQAALRPVREWGSM